MEIIKYKPAKIIKEKVDLHSVLLEMENNTYKKENYADMYIDGIEVIPYNSTLCLRYKSFTLEIGRKTLHDEILFFTELVRIIKEFYDENEE